MSFAVLFVMVGQAAAQWYWPPSYTEIVPQNPTSSDVVDIILGGQWGSSCIPNASAVSVVGRDIYFDVIWDYPPYTGCLAVITPWWLTESVDPLPVGTYTVNARLVGYPDATEYEPVAVFIVSDKQFVLSTKSLTVQEGQIATFTAALLLEPAGVVEVSVARQSGDPDITVESGGSLTFHPHNYNIPQTVTLAAVEDEDYFDGMAVFLVSAPGYLTAELNANEADKDMPSILYVDIGANGNNDGRSWEDGFNDLQDALSIAEQYPEVEEIRVAQGVYTPAEPNGNRNFKFQLTNVSMSGGYAGSCEPDPKARDVSIYKTVLSGDLNGDDGPDFANYGENTRGVVQCEGTVVLDGLTIAGGNAGSGGGIYNWTDCQLAMINCVVSNNLAMYGGGMYNNSGDISLANCMFIGNSATAEGGGIYSNTCNLTLVGCTFSSNSGGGMDGSRWYTNTAMTNCIFWGNGGASESGQIGNGNFTINYCCVQGWTGALSGTGNIGDDPLFADPNNNDYRLKSQAGRWDPVSQTWVTDANTSPCIDAGDPDSDWTTELWPHGKRINMGAYGGTPQASMSLSDVGNIADLDNNGIVDYNDMVLYAEDWLNKQVLLPEDLNRDRVVDFIDFAVFAENWPYQSLPILVDGDVITELEYLETVNTYPDNLNIDPNDYPVVLGRYSENLLVLIEMYFCSDVCPDYGRVVLVFEDITSAEECAEIGGVDLIDPAWGGYIGCAPDVE